MPLSITYSNDKSPVISYSPRVFDKILEYFKELISAGKLKTGDRLLPERDLSLSLGVSRASLREALRTMEMFGLIRILPKQGAYILPPNTASLSSIFSMMLSLKPSISENILEVRIIFECEGARLAAKRSSPQELAGIKMILDRMPRSVTGDDLGAQADFDFHSAIIHAAHNDMLTFMYETIGELLKRSHQERRVAIFNIPGALDDLVKTHESIYEAIASGDEESAGRRMREHFRFVQKYYDGIGRG